MQTYIISRSIQNIHNIFRDKLNTYAHMDMGKMRVAKVQVGILRVEVQASRN